MGYATIDEHDLLFDQYGLPCVVYVVIAVLVFSQAATLSGWAQQFEISQVGPKIQIRVRLFSPQSVDFVQSELTQGEVDMWHNLVVISIGW